MLDTCLECKENEVEAIELYCSHCSLDMLAQNMINSDYLNQLFTVKEAN